MILLDLAVRAVLLLVLVAFVLGCVAMFLDAHAKTSREALDAAIAHHPAKGTDPVRLAQMAAIAEAEEAWDRDVWGKGWTYVSGECTACGKDGCACRWTA